MSAKNKILSNESLLREKAERSPCTYRVSAIAFDRKGDVVGHAANSHSPNWNVVEKTTKGRPGTGLHAERRLMSRYGRTISTIAICRIGRGGDLLPIEPCAICEKVARKLGIKIVPIMSVG